MKTKIKGLSLILLIFAFPVFAAEIGQEVHIYPNGEIHLIGAGLFRKHANNLFTLKSWDIQWAVSIDTTDTKIKIESAYGAPIELSEILEGHLLEIQGKSKYENFEHSIEPILIKDLSIKTGEPPLSVLPPPPPQIPQTNSGKLNMILKLNYRGGQVKILQKFLQEQKYLSASEKISGVFGNITKKALKDFQQANALEATGTLGPKTRELINSLLK